MILCTCGRAASGRFGMLCYRCWANEPSRRKVEPEPDEPLPRQGLHLGPTKARGRYRRRREQPGYDAGRGAAVLPRPVRFTVESIEDRE